MRALALCLFGCLTAFPASAQAPAFNASGVIPSRAKRPTPLSPGMLVSIYGERLGPREACDGRDEWTSPGVYPPELCGVQVRVDGQTAGLLYVQERQINFEVPSGIPPDGTGELLVVPGGRPSPPVAVELGFDSALLTFAEPACVDLPIWVDVAAPPRWGGEISYSFGIDPTVMGCNEIEVLRDGRPLEKIPLAQDNGGRVIASIMCGSLGLRSKPRRIGGLPLHLLYRFDEAGRYELKLTMHNQSMRYPHPGISLRVTRSKWTAFTVLPSVPGRRAQKLAAMRRTAPSDPTELLTDYPPSILGRPDAQSMAMVAEQLYHRSRSCGATPRRACVIGPRR